MKTAEETAKEQLGKKIFQKWTGEVIFEKKEDLFELMEQFRKEGMEEAWNESLVNSTNIIRKARMLGKNNIKVYSFEEWYNNQIKE